MTSASTPDPDAARALIDANAYMTLATADRDGRPWASPVWFAHDGYTTFYWVSRPGPRHSRNLEVRPQLAIVIFDSTVPECEGQAVYMEAEAERVATTEQAHAMEVVLAPIRGARRRGMDRRQRQRAGARFACIAPPRRRTSCSTPTIAACRSIRQQRHNHPRIAPDEHGARDRGLAEPVAHAVHRRVERDRARDLERQRELDRVDVLEVRERQARPASRPRPG